MRQQRGAVFAALLVLVLTAGSPAIAQQSGYYVLDGFGGVHAAGGAPAVSPQTPYFGFDIAKDVVYVPRGSQGVDGILVLDGFGGVHAGGAIKGLSIAPTPPYFGFNVARAIALRANSPAVTAGNGNGVGSSICTFGTGGGVEVFTRTALGSLVNARFSFIVPGFAHGVIRSDASIRDATPELISVEHPSPGSYCLVFSPAPTGLQAESTVVSIHAER